jgi:hypothetical protein
MTSPIENLLSRVDSPKKGNKAGQYSAFCTHQVNRKERKLSITERTDGSLLLKCWGGCDFYEILKNLGLEVHELYPPRNLSGREPKRNPPLVSTTQCLELLHELVNCMVITVLNFYNGVELTPNDREQLLSNAIRTIQILEMTKEKS